MKQITTILLAGCINASVSAWGGGRIAASVLQLNELAGVAAAGDTIWLQDGVYTDAILKFHNTQGSDAAPVVIAAAHPGKVFFEGASRLSFSGQHIVVSGFTWRNGGEIGTKSVIEFRTASDKVAEYCTLQDCVIDHYNVADKETDNKWVYVFGQHNKVQRCLFKDKDNKGPTLVVWLENGVAAYHVIAQNYFLGRQNPANIDNGLESLRIGLGKTSMTDAYCTISENRFENCDGEIETVSNKSCHNSYLYNTFYHCDGGLTLRHGNNCLVQGNYFFGGSGKRSYGIRIIGEGHRVQYNYCYGLNGASDKFRAPVTLVNGMPDPEPNSYFQVKRAIIANNSFINCDAPTFRFGAGKAGATEAPDSCVVINNLVATIGLPSTFKNYLEERLSEPTHFHQQIELLLFHRGAIRQRLEHACNGA